jgi:hypothetical protein
VEKLRRFTFAACCLLLVAPSLDARGASERQYFVFIGSMAGPSGQGIYAYRFNALTGEAQFLGLAAATPSRSFLIVNPDQRFL